MSCPACANAERLSANGPPWFQVLQAHVIAVQSNDRAVQLFRAGRLDAAIVELQRGLEVSPRYATGHSNLGFLHLRKGQFAQAVACLLRALEVDPHHRDAPAHLVDVLSALIEELVQIGCSDGFLSTQPGGKFDEANRHSCARAIGALIAKIGQQRVFKVGSQPLASDLLMDIVIADVAQKMGDLRHGINLKSAWSGIGGGIADLAARSQSVPHRLHWQEKGGISHVGDGIVSQDETTNRGGEDEYSSGY